MKKFTHKIETDKDTIFTIIKALDLYSRIGIGQFREIMDHPTFDSHLMNEFKKEDGKVDWTLYHAQRDRANNYLTEARNVLYNDHTMPKSGSWGIHNKNVDDSCRQVFDIIQILRHEFYDGHSHTVDSSVHLTAKNKVKLKIDEIRQEGT